jgi:hypothetical protein
MLLVLSELLSEEDGGVGRGVCRWSSSCDTGGDVAARFERLLDSSAFNKAFLLGVNDELISLRSPLKSTVTSPSEQMSHLLSFDVTFETVSGGSMRKGHLKAFDVSELEMNSLFGKDLVQRNGIYFEATLGDIPAHGWGLRRHQLLKSIEKLTKSSLVCHSISPLNELWHFRRTPGERFTCLSLVL